MNKNISIVFAFVSGVAIGVAASYKVASTKYSNIANEEIESVIERFESRIDRPVKKQEDSKNVPIIGANNPDRIPATKSSVLAYKSEVEQCGYDQISKQQSKKGDDEVVKNVENESIYVISPDEFNTLPDYSTETLYYSSDNYVLDASYQALDDLDIKNTIDHDPYGHFGEYEDDSVYVRNEDRMCDYEILLSQKTYAEIQED